MGLIEYRGKWREARRWKMRAEFVIVLTAGMVLAALLVGAGYYYFITLKVGF